MRPITQPPSAPALWEANYLTTILPPELSLSLLIPGDTPSIIAIQEVMLKMNSAHYMRAYRMRLLGCRQPLTLNIQHESEVIVVHHCHLYPLALLMDWLLACAIINSHHKQ